MSFLHGPIKTNHPLVTLREVALEILDIAREGLHRRARRSAAGDDETHFLDPLFAIAGSARTPAEELPRKFPHPLAGRNRPGLHRLRVLAAGIWGPLGDLSGAARQNRINRSSGKSPFTLGSSWRSGRIF